MSSNRYTRLLADLQKARTDEQRAWLTMAFNLESLPVTVQDAVQAAAVPHWFDGAVLAALLQKPRFADSQAFQALLAQPYIEPFPGRGWNVHERTRNLLLSHAWQKKRRAFRDLNRRAAAYCAAQEQYDFLWEVETHYHRLLARETGAPQAYSDRCIDLYNHFEFKKLDALARRVLEAVEAGWLTGKAVAITYESLGNVHFMLSEYELASQRFEQALPIYRQIKNRVGEANCISSLGDVATSQSDYNKARMSFAGALTIYRDVGDQLGEANCIQSLGDIHQMLSQYRLARRNYEKALKIYIAISNRLGEATAIRCLGDVHRTLEEYGLAQQRYEQALAIYRENAAHLGEANCIQSLGEMEMSCSNYEQARLHFEQALPIYREIGNRQGEANCIYSLGDVHYQLNAINASRRFYEESLEIYRRTGNRQGEANVIFSLGDVHFQLGEHEAARQRYEHALLLYQEIGSQAGESQCLRALGSISRRKGRLEEAVDWYLKAEETQPDHYLTMLNLAGLFRQLNDPERSAHYISLARSLIGIQDWYNLACLESIAGQVDTAFAHLAHAAAMDTFDRISAWHDLDLEPLRQDPRFFKIVGLLPQDEPDNSTTLQSY